MLCLYSEPKIVGLYSLSLERLARGIISLRLDNQFCVVDMNNLSYDVFQTELGWIGTLLSPRGLRRLSLKPTPVEALDDLGPDVARAKQDPVAVDDIRQRLSTYFQGAVQSMDDIPLDMEDAPPFFKAAWEACRTIPPGETRSYAWLAAAAGRPRAFRAAGQAMAKNPLAIVIPCHRVIGSDGGLHGYGGGLDKKARLLEMDRNAGERGS